MVRCSERVLEASHGNKVGPATRESSERSELGTSAAPRRAVDGKEPLGYQLHSGGENRSNLTPRTILEREGVA